MSGRVLFSADVAGGQLQGWVEGTGVPVLLLHGGPGVGYEILDELRSEIADGFRVAGFQQRGLEPSTLEGPFTVEQAISDVLAVLDALEWTRALIVGHSWGGHLALRFMATHPDRLLGGLMIEPIGVVGDGGMSAFSNELLARTPSDDRHRALALRDRAMAGNGTINDASESLELVWPAYFADPDTAPPMPPTRISLEASAGIRPEIPIGLEEVAAALATVEVPYGVIAGAGSPIPWGQAARASAELSPRAFLTVVPGAGHFPWFEAPGCIRDSLLRLTP